MFQTDSLMRINIKKSTAILWYKKKNVKNIISRIKICAVHVKLKTVRKVTQNNGIIIKKEANLGSKKKSSFLSLMTDRDNS